MYNPRLQCFYTPPSSAVIIIIFSLKAIKFETCRKRDMKIAAFEFAANFFIATISCGIILSKYVNKYRRPTKAQYPPYAPNISQHKSTIVWPHWECNCRDPTKMGGGMREMTRRSCHEWSCYVSTRLSPGLLSANKQSLTCCFGL